jgi:dUTP pyrophosphatase
MPQIQVWRELPGAKLPTQATDRAQCIDLYAAEDIELLHGETKAVSLGIRVVLPEGYGLEFRERSGLALKGIVIGAGIIDEDYHGSLKAIVRYLHPLGISLVDGFKIAAGDKIVQAELVKRIPIEIKDIGPLTFQHAIEASRSDRGDRGFGSTDE